MSAPPIIGSRTRLAAVLGWPVEHSKSPALHNAAFAAAGVDAVYVALAIAPADLSAAVAGLRAMRALGASVTVPHKQALVSLCDSLSPAAAQIGAVNTLEFHADGRLIGHNTDAAGYVHALQEASGQSIAGKRVLLLGGGGAARALAYGVQEAGAISVRVVARSPTTLGWTQAMPWTAELLATELPSCDLLVDCTSMGLSAEAEALVPAPVDVHRLPAHALVSTLVYHRETALLQAARARHLRTIDGAGMLVHQGALAFEIWTGKSAPLLEMRQAFAQALTTRPA